MMNNSSGACVSLSVLAFGLFSQPATAQVAATEQIASDAIVVTARRREESIDRVPVSVTAINAEQISKQNLSGVEDLQYLTPSLTVTSNTDRTSNNYTLRGQGTTYGTDTSVVAYFAEVPIPGGGNGPSSLFDLSNVQVLNGPQGTLFGRNSVGGAILFTPARPVNNVEGYGKITYGNYDEFSQEAVVNLPIVDDKVLLRAGFTHRKRDGFTRDVVNGTRYDNIDASAARVSLLIKPGGGFENLTTLNYSSFESEGAGIKLSLVNPAGVAGFVFPTLAQAAADQVAWGPRRTALSGDSLEKQRLIQLVNTTTVDIGDTTRLKNIVSYSAWRSNRRLDVDGSVLPVVEYVKSPSKWGNVQNNNQPAIDQFTEELQLSGTLADKMLDWTVGVYYQHNDPKHTVSRQRTFGGSPNWEDRGDKLTSKAVYAQATLDFGTLTPSLEGLKLTGGYRRTSDKRRDYSDNFYPVGATPAPGDPCALIANTYPNCLVRYARNFKAGTYTAALEYQATNELMFYATARSGFKSGGFNLAVNPASIVASFEPEKVKDIEVGAKGNFDLGAAKLRVSVAGFRDIYSDIQRPVVLSVTPVAVDVINAAKATIKGIEAQAGLNFASGLSFSGSLSYLDAKYNRFVTPFEGDFSGTRLPYTPKIKASFIAGYEHDLDMNRGSLTATASYTYQSRYKNLDVFDPDVNVPSYGLTNVSLGWNKVMGSPIDLSAFITNVTNKTYIIAKGNWFYSLGFTTNLYGEPRMYGASLTYHFGS